MESSELIPVAAAWRLKRGRCCFTCRTVRTFIILYGRRSRRRLCSYFNQTAVRTKRPGNYAQSPPLTV